MSTTAESSNERLREYLKRVMLELHNAEQRLGVTEQQLRDAKAAQREPIAIVGIGCRYPGGIADLESFWHLLDQGVDAVAEVPRERWDVDALYDPDPDVVGKMMTRSGGFVREIDQFDPAFFGISPREAKSMDPQQRLLLETSLEALERAGMAGGGLVGSSTGVFVGVMYQDYGTFGGGLEGLDGYVGTGSASSVASGRISYALGLQGPSMTVDTACSSSLVTVHLACQALRNGECSLALAGGVALMLTPNLFVEFSRLRGLAPDGRCKSFSAAADGVGWAEGCGMLVLERLSDAQRNGHPVLALIRGSAVNQDGRSNGITAPNGPSQEAVIRRALEQAGVSPAEVQYVECHGTGTSLGDPIEVQALGAVMSAGHDAEHPVVLGSVKSNLGHTQAAAGVAGIIKVVLALEHARIPKNLHFDAPSPHIAWDELPVKVAAEAVDWPRNGARRIAGVSSFGISGTNAHVVLEEAPSVDVPVAAPSRGAELVVISAKSAEALSGAAVKLRAHLESHAEQELGDVAYSLATTRAHHEHRLSLSVSTRADLLAALDGIARGDSLAAVSRGRVGAASSKVVFLFSGQGSQWLGMGRQLLAEEAVFQKALEACDQAIATETGWSVIAELGATAETSQFDHIDVVQPALFAMSVALAALWRSWGVEPDMIVGHSMGEVAAACVAGALSLEDAAAVICRRSRLLRRISGRGEMALVRLTLAEAKEAIAAMGDRVSVAVSNSRRSTVLSGEPAALASLLTTLEGRGVYCKRVKVDVASHSPQVDGLREELLAALASVSPRSAIVPMLSTVTGRLLEGEELTASYWADNLRQPVRFAEAVEGLLSKGHGLFLEMSPHAVLLPEVEDLRSEANIEGAVVGSLRRDHPERAALLESLGALYVAGYALDFARLFPVGRRVELPTYPWQRERYWVEASSSSVRAGEATGHPLLGVRVSMAGSGVVYESSLSLAEQPWLGDHRVAGHVFMPGAGLVEMMRAAASSRLAGEPAEVVSLVLQAPLVIPEHGVRRVQVVLTEDDNRFEVKIYSQPADRGAEVEWTLHATAEVRRSASPTPASLDLDAIRARCTKPVDVAHAYEGFAVTGLSYGPSFQGVQSLRRGEEEALAEVALPPALDGAETYGVHPALLDAAFHAMAGLPAREEGLFLPFSMDRMTVHQWGASAAVAYVRRTDAAESLAADVTLADAEGHVLVEVVGLRGRRVEPETLRSADEAADVLSNAVYRLEWLAAASSVEARALTGRWVVVASRESLLADSLVARLESAGVTCTRVNEVDRLAERLPAENVVCVWGNEAGAETPDAALGVTTEGVAVVQTLAKRAATARLWWVTTGAVAATPKEIPAAALSALWGLGRAVMQEHPEHRCTLVDVECGHAGAESLFDELSMVDDENQVAWRSGTRHVARLARAPAAPLPNAENYALETAHAGVLDQLRLVASRRRAPREGEVEIAVHASGLNFKDVIAVLGVDVTPGREGSLRAPLGGECAGVVAAVGTGVEGLRVGDAVMALTAGAFQRWVTVDRRFVVRIPTGLSFEQASAVPVAFLTAWYALHDLARLEAGERLLIHAAAGGVGMAAVQVAQGIGAEVLGTASPAKWDTVRALGVEQIASSRNLEFVDTFRALTGGACVDVVLNSLAREFVDGGLSLLSEGGRFIEMGKTDIRDSEAVTRGHPGVYYQAFDLMEAGADRIAEMLAAIARGFASGHLRPLPVRTFPMTEAESAFRLMSQGHHIGKLVLLPPRELRPAGTVLITGGLGALGLCVARWLAGRGVNHLVLTGRRGSATPGAAEAVTELEGLGAKVTVAAVDVADREALAAVLASIPPAVPLRGVIHAAGVLDDGMLVGQSAERVRQVMSPKVLGACHLDALTREADLDLFVLFSSAAGALGSEGQGAYAAANAFLDGLAAGRRAEGLPAQSLAWGLWIDRSGKAAGLASGLDSTQQARVTRQGMKALSFSEGIGLFAAALERPEAELVLVPLDLRAMGKAFGGAVPPLWRSLVRAPRRAAAPRGAWAQELAELSPARRLDAVLEIVRAEVARVLSLAGPERVAEGRPLKEVGLDSLMAVELRNVLATRVGTTLPATLAFDFPTPAAIAYYLLSKVLKLGEATAGTVVAPTSPVDEPIALVGIGCRYPGGVSDPESFWRLLDEGVDAVTEVPRERWDVEAWYDADPDAVGKMTTRWGGFLEGLDRFDPAFFGIGRCEASSVDPQQRLLLETSWEALERAGIGIDGLMGSNTGVYIGISGAEYQARALQDVTAVDAYALLGTAHSAMVGRLSYFLGLKGPNMPIDTACSSSLVAVHLACQALRNGECSLALAGGANVVLEPEGTVYFSRLRAMSPTGRCHTFSADADGYVRAEGAGVVVLERLSEARRNGHRILALIRGSAVNQDGRSNGLTAPNGPSQEMVIREALRRAGVAAKSVGYLECHGTGTPLGDPIEVQAAAAVLGEGRGPDRPLVLGSLKSNIGHTEAAAGVGSLIKAVLALQHERIPKSLHFTKPNPHIAWDALPVKVATEALEWRRNGSPRRAGVSAFGFSGTNAHVVLEEAPVVDAAAAAPARAAELVVISAKSAAALDEAGRRLRAHVEAHAESSLEDVAYSLATTRAHHGHRLSLAIRTREGLLSALDAVARGETPPACARGELGLRPGKVAWLFTGQGSQRPGMGRELAAEWPVFREALEQACAALDVHLEMPLRDVMWAEPGTAQALLLDQTGYTQPALFALEVALAALWRSWGALPDLLAGHSIGELSAAYVAGVFSLADASRLVAGRGRLMQALPAGGAMVSIAASESDVEAEVLSRAARVSLAVVNGPTSVVISGAEAAVLSIGESFARRGVRTKRLSVSHAFHSLLMEPMLEEFGRVAESVTYRAAEVPLVSNVTGRVAGPEIGTPSYWVEHVRAGVRFSEGVRALHEAGATCFLELGPRATLLGLVPESLPVASSPRLLASLRSERPETEALLEALGGHYAEGGAVAWKGVFPGARVCVDLPTYAWQRERHWIESAVQRREGEVTGHPLLGVRASMPGATTFYETVLSVSEQAWLGDHRVAGRIFLPAAGMAEMLRAAAEHVFESDGVDVTSVVFQEPLVLREGRPLRVQTVVEAVDGRWHASVYSEPAAGAPASRWTLHATAEMGRTAEPTPARLDLEAVRARCAETVDLRQVYESFAAAGLDYGPAFQGVQTLQRGPGEVLAEASLSDGVEGAERCGIHPALLDAAFQASVGLSRNAELALPFALEKLVVYKPGRSVVLAYVRPSQGVAEDHGGLDVTLVDEQGNVLVDAVGLRLRPVTAEALGHLGHEHTNDVIHRLEWLAAASSVEARALTGRWVVVASRESLLADSLVARLESAGVTCTRVNEVDRLAERLPAENVVCVWGNEAGAETPDAALGVTTEGVAVVQTLAKRAATARLWWVTTGAVAATPKEIPAAALSALWGLGRAVMQEHPEHRCTLVDVECGHAGAESLFDELSMVDDENQVAWRSGTRHVARLARAPAAPLPNAENYALETAHAGVLDQLRLVASRRRAPREGEVEIAVHASGLNFKDVIAVLGVDVTPGREGSLRAPLGGECAGVVAAVGTGVEGLRVGDAVMALTAGAFQRWVTVDRRFVVRIPTGLSFEQASAVPVAFLTAWYALHDLARLEAGERLLIHAAAGGVGMAAVQVAQGIGAEVLGTASPAKWDTVRALGVEQIASSRNLEFVDTFRALTGGACVDVVLNSLAREFVDGGLSLLSEGGRFIEMGKTDIRDSEAVTRGHPGVYYQAFDLMEAGADRIAEMLGAIARGFASGHLRPLPVRTFPMTEAESAFRLMSQGHHIGKLVLLPPRELRPAGTVLITGGLGALGLCVARWLAGRGVNHLVLTGRRGNATPGAAEAVTELEGLGAKVTVAAVDVADREALAAVLASIPPAVPLRGVIHAAGVLDDGMLVGQSAERVRQVMSPKVLGACHLDALTREADLDLFVLFSSAAGALGSAGQGAYAAANAFLDGLAAGRRAEGLPAQSLAWGLWTDDADKAAGLASLLDRTQQAHVTRQGMKALSFSKGIALLGNALERPEAGLVLMPLDLRAMSKAFGGAVPPLWRTLVRAPRRAAAARGGWVEELAALPSVRRFEAVLDVVRAEVARVLALPGPDRVAAGRPFKELGLDSLLALELRNALGKRAGMLLPATLAFDFPTPAVMAQHLLENFLTTGAGAAVRAPIAASRVLDEPIAIVGMGCRFPGGVRDPESFWRLLDDGVDAVTEVPRERWDIDAWYDPDPDASGKMTTRWGGFLEALDRFDAGFFGISPGEAVSIDPQQRLLLETSWEALERAGIGVERLLGSDTGVYIGICGAEYQARAMQDLTALDAYSLLGTVHSAMVGRLSYFLGLKGPNMPIDTACSSSLVAVHLACQALRNGECSLALAGGANVVLEPDGTVYFSRLRAMSPTGRCRAFSADADGYVRAEGAGVVVLERLSDARRHGHPILALIRGSAVNQDGRSNGLTAPNGPSQEMVIREALRRAGVPAKSVGYLECHGTGTPLGDPIEVQAAAAVLGEERDPERPLMLGSLKSNIGHTEAAAGVGGLIKAVLALQHRRIPKSLHVTKPNPHIAWHELPVKVATDAVEWQTNGTPRRAGVSSFGISGTNAHVVLEEAAAIDVGAAQPARAAELVVMSAKSAAALDETAARLRAYVQTHSALSLRDLAYSLATTRSHHEHRLALAVSTSTELVDALDAAGRGESTSGVSRGCTPASTSKVVFVFPGQGSQWLGMGRELLAEEPVFREALEACDRAIASEAGWSVISELHATAEESQLDRIDVVQPALFAMGVALAALWRSWGIEPDVVVGHSMGEVAAACAAGALTPQDAAAVICRRSRLLRKISGQGEMAQVQLTVQEAEAALVGFEDRVSVAVSNSRRSTVLSGEPTALRALLARLEARGVHCKRVKVDVASHSPQVDALREELVSALAEVTPRATTVAMRSTVTGRRVEGAELVATYWSENLRQPVRFADVVGELLAEGYGLFVEMSGHAVLLPAVEELRTEARAAGVVVGSLRREQPERRSLLSSLGALYVAGYPLDSARLFPSGRRVELPTYPWQRERYWIEASPERSRAGEATGHPLVGVRVSMAGSGAVYESMLSLAEEPWLGDHRVTGRVFVPAACLVEMMRAAGEHQLGGDPAEVSSVVLQAPLVLPEHGGRRVQVVLTEAGGQFDVKLYSQLGERGSDGAWTLHAAAEVGRSTSGIPSRLDLAALRARCTNSVEVARVYDGFAGTGLYHGPAFQGMRSLVAGAREALAEVTLPAAAPGAERYGVHPALLDAAFHAMAGLPTDGDGLFLPFAIDRMTVHQPGVSAAVVCVRQTNDGASRGVHVTLADADGNVLVEVAGMRVQRVEAGTLLGVDAPADRSRGAVYRVEWPVVKAPEPTALPAGRWVVVAAEGDGVARAVVERLQAVGCTCSQTIFARLSETLPAEHVICIWDSGGREEAPAAALCAASEGLEVVQTLAKQSPAPRMLWVTAGAVAVQSSEEPSVASASLWGLGRTVMAEHPELGCTILDLEAKSDPAEMADLVLRELGVGDGESQVAWRRGQRHVARLARAPDVRIAEWENYALESKQKGMLDQLTLVDVPRRAPEAGEVEIAVRAAGLNFRDVLSALGMYPGEAGPLGGECAGVVVAAGSGVVGTAVGDAVMALASGSFQRFVTVDARLVAKVPHGLSFEQAATVPIVFLTAYYALHDLAGLQPGERLLVHAVTGGVGMAAVQLARWIGAEVVGTASPSKWEVVRSLGIERVASSRERSFVEAFRAVGVDVVLNALSGELVDASLSLLSPGGRFIEMGKTDIRDPAAVSNAHRGVMYLAFDLMEAGTDRLAEMLAVIVDGFAKGRLKPLPVRTFPVTEAEAAFRFMGQARHVGKLALTPSRELRTDGTVLITGGLGVLGLNVARWLVSRGVRRLVLTSRRGPSTPGAVDAVAELEAVGAEVTVHAVDVARREALAEVLASIPAQYPLRGVVHAAGVLDDGVLSDQSAERFARVLSPKIDGASHLDTLTRDVELDFFVLFSSAAGTFGAAGQGSYAAANAFLDALAAARRACGLPAQSLAWGLWTDAADKGAGLASLLDPTQQARLTIRGMKALSVAEGIAALESALSRPEAHLTLVALDIRAMGKGFDGVVPPLWRGLVRAPRHGATARAAWAEELGALPPNRRLDAALETVCAEVARVLSLAGPGAVATELPLRELGLDSLMALELRNALGRRVGTVLPATLAFDFPTPAAIARHLVETARGFTAPAVAKAAPSPTASSGLTIGSVTHASDEETLAALQADFDALMKDT